MKSLCAHTSPLSQKYYNNFKQPTTGLTSHPYWNTVVFHFFKWCKHYIYSCFFFFLASSWFLASVCTLAVKMQQTCLRWSPWSLTALAAHVLYSNKREKYWFVKVDIWHTWIAAQCNHFYCHTLLQPCWQNWRVYRSRPDQGSRFLERTETTGPWLYIIKEIFPVWY